MSTIKTALAVLFAVLLANRSIAAIVFDNGGPDPSVGFGLNSDVYYYDLNADDFVVPTGAPNLIGARWWGFNSLPPEPDDFTLQVFADEGGAPPSLPFYSGAGVPPSNALYTVHLGDVTRTSLSDGLFEYHADFSPLPLVENTTYWISIFNGEVPWQWAWAISGSPGNSRLLVIDSISGWQGYGSSSWESAFELTFDSAAVPEPASLVLWGLGAIGFAVASRGRRAKKTDNRA